MDILKPTAVIGTNAWGSALYEKAMGEEWAASVVQG